MDKKHMDKSLKIIDVTNEKVYYMPTFLSQYFSIKRQL